MKLHRSIDVAIAQAIAVGEKEILLAHMRQGACEATAGLGFGAGIEQGHRPVLLIVMGVVLHLRLAPELQRHVAGVPQVIAKVILDDLALVTEAEDEFLVPMMSVGFHDMPENRPAADRHHGFGAILRLLAQPRAESATENDHLHDRSLALPVRTGQR